MMLLGYVDVNYAKILEFGESRFPPLGAPKEQNAPLCTVLATFLLFLYLASVCIDFFTSELLPLL